MSEDYKFQASFRFGVTDNRGTPQEMINVRANTQEEFRNAIRAVNGVAQDLFLVSQTIRSSTVDDSNVAANTGQQPANPVPQTVPQQPPGGAQPAQAQPTPGHPHCAHGTMTFKQGISKKNGQPWSAYMCPAPQGQPQCAPQFL